MGLGQNYKPMAFRTRDQPSSQQASQPYSQHHHPQKYACQPLSQPPSEACQTANQPLSDRWQPTSQPTCRDSTMPSNGYAYTGCILVM